MAYLVPSNLPSPELLPGQAAELETLAMLRRRLPPSYYIFHGVHWARGWERSPAFGEADFIVVNEAGDTLVIEQKMGALEEGNGELLKRYDGKAKSVNSQLHRTLDLLREKFKRQTGHPINLDFLLFCPGYRVRNVVAAGFDRERVVDAADVQKLPEKIQELLPVRPATHMGPRVLRFFEQTLDLVPDIHARLSAAERHYTRGIGGLAETARDICGAPLKLAIRGTAGCGKSMVAVKLYQDAISKGKRPILLCFNRALKEKMKASVAPGGVVETWYGAIAEILKATGRPLDHSGSVEWAAAVEQVLDGAIPDSWVFDTVIVDEGQDFHPAWGDMLELLAHPQSDQIWLDDPHQAIQFGRNETEGEWPRKNWTGFSARSNFRSPQSVARYIRSLLPEFAFEPANPLPGADVHVTRVKDSADTATAVGQIAGRLIASGYREEDIIVLSLRGQESASLAASTRAGRSTISRFTGEYDMFGNQVWSKGQLRFDTIRRYKGQQDPVVILTDTDMPIDPEREALWRRLMFSALTRATDRVEIVAQEPTANVLASV